MIVPPKKESVQVKFRWNPDLRDRIDALAKRTGRTMNDTGEQLMRWALDRAEQEVEELAQVETSDKGRKR